MLRISLLGDVNVTLNGRPLSGLPSRAAEALLIYLACSPRPVRREKLAELLWADRSQAQASTNLRTILTALRREIGDFLIVTRDTLAFNFNQDAWLDVVELERQLQALTLPASALLPDEIAQRLQTALDLYHGDFLEGFTLRDGLGFEEWASLQRERLRLQVRQALRALAQHQLAAGDYSQGILTAIRWQRLDPYDEEACRTLMWLLARSGQRNAALQHYQTLEQRLAVDLDVSPAPATTGVWQRLQQMDFPPRFNLPPESTPFIGRMNEITALERLVIATEPRLVTILGQGGIGKTRLASQLARNLVNRLPGRFLDGIYFVPLAAVDSLEALPLRLAEAVSLPLSGKASPRQEILTYLRERELMLILDNFEHLLDAPASGADLLADILQQATQVKLLVTSRQRLNLYEELVYDLAGLDVPPQEAVSPESFSAVALFLQSAARTRQGAGAWQPTKDEFACIAHACHLVEGVPLAIELAAAWVRHYACVEITHQIEESLDFLQAPYRNLPERHRSLRAVFDHSWSLLDATQQSVFAQLSVLRADFNRAAASATLASEAQPMLAGLVDHSLLQCRADGRYALHPTLRQYAAEKLARDAAEQEATQQRHAAYFLGWLAGLGDGESPEQRAAIRAEMENLRLAWEWAAQRKEIGLLERAAPVLHDFYSAESWFVEGIEAFQLALNALNDEFRPHASLICDLLGRQARMQIHIGQLSAARTGLERAYALLEHVPQPERRATILGYQAITHYYAGDYARAAELAGQALEISQAAGDLEGAATELNFLGSCHKARGAYDLAHQCFEQAVAVSRQLSDPLGEAMVLNNLGNLAQARSDFDNARQYYLQSSELFKAQNHAHGASTTLSNAGLLAYHQGAYDQAQALLNESLDMKQKMADQRGIAVALLRLGDVATALGAYDRSRQQLLQALSLAQQTGDFKLALEILVAVADLHIHTHQEDTARRYLGFVLQQTATSQEARQRANQLADVLNAASSVIQENLTLTYEAILFELLGE